MVRIALNIPLATLLGYFLAKILEEGQSVLVRRYFGDGLELKRQAVIVTLATSRHLTLKRRSHSHHNLKVIGVALHGGHRLANTEWDTAADILAKLRQHIGGYHLVRVPKLHRRGRTLSNRHHHSLAAGWSTASPHAVITLALLVLLGRHRGDLRHIGLRVRDVTRGARRSRWERRRSHR